MADPVPASPRFFNFDAQAVRVVGDPDKPWFVAKDVCAALGIEWKGSGNSGSLENLDEDEKGSHAVSTLGGPQMMGTVNESGLYALIFRSRKAQARVFRRWVTSEVLPALRRTGTYSTAPAAQHPELTELVAAMRELVTALQVTIRPKPPRANLRATYLNPATHPDQILSVLQDGPVSAELAMDALRGRFGSVGRSVFYTRLAELVASGSVVMHPGARYSAKGVAA